MMKERLGLLLNKRSMRQAAADWGIAFTTLRNWLSTDTSPSFDIIAEIAKKEGIDLNWLAYGEERGSTSIIKYQNLSNENAIEVFQYDFKASAGPGCLVVSEDPVAKFELSKEWLIRQGLNGKKLAVVPVCGDSMEPTLIDEDLMLVVLIDDHKEARDGVCVIRIDDEVMVKRIQYDFMERGYHVKSDNDSYQSFFVGPEYQDRFSIIGRMARVLQRAKR